MGLELLITILGLIIIFVTGGYEALRRYFNTQLDTRLNFPDDAQSIDELVDKRVASATMDLTQRIAKQDETIQRMSEEHGATVSKLKAEIKQLRADLARAHDLLHAKDQAIERLGEANTAMQETLKSLQERLNRTDEALDKLRDENVEKVKELAERDAAVRQMETEIQQLRDRLKELQDILQGVLSKPIEVKFSFDDLEAMRTKQASPNDNDAPAPKPTKPKDIGEATDD